MKTLMSLALAAGIALGTTISAEAYDRRVQMVNRSETPIEQIYGSNVGTNSWEEDILGPNILDPGERYTYDFDDGLGYCRYDVKIVFLDGTERYEQAVNFCEVAVFNIY